MSHIDVQMEITGKMPILKYMRAQACVYYLCRHLEIVEECFEAKWVMLPLGKLEMILLRLGLEWNDGRRLYTGYPIGMSEVARIRLSIHHPDWFSDGVRLAREAKRYADG